MTLALRLVLLAVLLVPFAADAQPAHKPLRIGALWPGSDRAAAPYLDAFREGLSELGTRSKLPSMFELREFVDSGGLIAYGPNLLDLFRRAAIYVDKILKSAKPADLPVEQPTTFELVINLKTAKALGLTIPQPLLLRADHVVE
jgi:ABC-type uncharacterized transport system substrate-binding protein